MLRRPPLGPARRRPPTARPGDSRRLVTVARPAAEEADPLARSPEVARLEAALFAADEPLTAARLAEVARLPDAATVRRLVGELQSLHEIDGAPFEVAAIADGFQLLSRPAFHPWLTRLERATTAPALSGSLLETLAVVAYRQPVTRADVDAVRGVASGDYLRQLLERGLLRHAGRDPSLGRPQRFTTTRKFLQLFGLRALSDLPPVPDLARPKGAT